MTRVSIIIATSGRLAALQETLKSLRLVRTPEDFSLEVVLVENGVRSEIEQQLSSLLGTRFLIKYIHEAVAGKSRALNIAVTQATGNIFLFTDDDVRFPTEWLVGMCMPLIRGEGAVVVGGSRLAPHLLRNWMTRQHRSLLASTEYLLDDAPSEFAGINMACLREVFAKVPQFDPELGGGGIGNCEDCLFSYQLKEAGYKFVSRTTLHVEHHPDSSRLCYGAWVRASRAFGRSKAYVAHHFYHQPEPFARVRLMYMRLKLRLRRLLHPRRGKEEEGILPWEFSYRVDIAQYEQFLHERRRPRNYSKRGLIKRVAPLRISAAFAPVWPNNPYHNELARAVGQHGVDADLFENFKRLNQHFRSRKNLPQIVHLHNLPFFMWQPLDFVRYCVFVTRLLRMRRQGVKIVWTIHDYRNHDNPQWRVEHGIGWFIARRVDALILHGPTAKAIVLAGWGKALEPRMHIIPHGNFIGNYRNEIGREAARAQLGLAPQNLVLLFLGWIRPYKGVPELIRAFRQRAGENATLVIAGSPIDEAIGKEVELAIGGDQRVRYRPGFVKDDEIQIFMNASDAMVLPYARIFTSGAAILAMSFGKACIAPRMGGVIDALDSRGAVLFEPGVPGELDRALAEVLEGRHDLQAMGRYNRARAEEWTWSKVGQETAAVYRACLNG